LKKAEQDADDVPVFLFHHEVACILIHALTQQPRQHLAGASFKHVSAGELAARVKRVHGFNVLHDAALTPAHHKFGDCGHNSIKPRVQQALFPLRPVAAVDHSH
jgi:hypothetical protein